MRRISLTRRLVQALSFAVIVFGGFLLAPGPDRSAGEIVAESGYGGSFERAGGVRWVQREKMALQTYLPVTSCYYQHRGLFSGCSLLFLSESLTWLTPLAHVLPHLLLLLVLLFVFGRLWCGWVCPFGLLSDLLSWLRELLGVDHLQLSRRWRQGLVWTKYVLLFATLALSALAALPALASSRQSLLLPFCQLCLGKFASPLLSFAQICWTNYSDAITTVLSILGLLTLALFFVGLGVRRLYCRICPIGGLAAPFNRYGLIALHKEARRCTSCGACARVCPVDNLSVYSSAAGGEVSACECTLCLRCVEACPETGCLQATLLGRRIARS